MSTPPCKVCDVVGCQEPWHKSATIPSSAFKTPMPTLVGSKERREKAANAIAHTPPHPERPVKRRLNFEEEDKGSYGNIEIFERVHSRYATDKMWLRRPRPNLNTITNNLRAVEVHLQQLREQQEASEEHVLNKIARLGESQQELGEKVKSALGGISCLDTSVDTLEEEMARLSKNGDLHYEGLDSIDDRQDKLEEKLNRVIESNDRLRTALDNITTHVTNLMKIVDEMKSK